MTEAPFNWKQPAGKALEFALNRALALDEDTRAALRGLDGQRDRPHRQRDAVRPRVTWTSAVQVWSCSTHEGPATLSP